MLANKASLQSLFIHSCVVNSYFIQHEHLQINLAFMLQGKLHSLYECKESNSFQSKKENGPLFWVMFRKTKL